MSPIQNNSSDFENALKVAADLYGITHPNPDALSNSVKSEFVMNIKKMVWTGLKAQIEIEDDFLASCKLADMVVGLDTTSDPPPDAGTRQEWIELIKELVWIDVVKQASSV